MKKINILGSEESLKVVTEISDAIDNRTFHHHYHVLYDIANLYNPEDNINYLEIGCYGGGSACLLLQRPNTNVVSVDLGHPIPPEVVLKNVSVLNKHNNKYEYIQGDSKDINNFNKVKIIHNQVDILFIDGDHTYNGVKSDFELYSKLVKDGGYIVFDDYNDHVHSPDVKNYVDNLVENINDEYEIIGTIKNTWGARPSDLVDGNCFILRKKNKIGIVIPTYKRLDGRTYNYLERCLNSVKNQTFKNYKVFLIGDDYEDNDEFVTLSTSIIDDDKIHYVNLPIAEERSKYTNNPSALWSYGGVNATNYGVNLALENGYEYICHLDHDDYWENNHLSSISEAIENTQSPFVYTKSKYHSSFLPTINSNAELVVSYPSYATLIHSSVCMNFRKIPLFYRDLFKETGAVGLPADGELWNRVNAYMLHNNLIGYFINKMTCSHDEEGHIRN
jgi:predicted O-methyltransferase YrrM